MSIVFKFLQLLFRIFPIVDNKIVAQNFEGKGRWESPEYIIKEILARNLGYEIYWAQHETKTHQARDGVNYIQIYSIAYFFHLTTAKVWIDSVRKPSFIKKRRDQFYIQTWHAGIATKKIEAEAKEKLSPQYVRDAIRDSGMADLFLSNSKAQTARIREGMWYGGKVLELGLPKNDCLVEDRKPSLPQERSEGPLKVLFAPTFRDDQEQNIPFERIKEIYCQLAEKLGAIELAVRKHPADNKKIKEGNGIRNAQGDDLNVWLIWADILITDYSSVIFDYALTGKPAFLYTPDEDHYEQDRGLFYKLNELPFSKGTTIDQLTQNIISLNHSKYRSDLEIFFKEIGQSETGRSAKAVVDIIERTIKK